ncbi:MAG: hypothetical protein Q4F67_15450, partial [Propionibacteriaceae bacterium]|nr:hypothetical protein [Propionibacteriaceae bacterium]
MRVRRASAGRRVVLIVGGIVVGLVVALVLVVFFGQRQLIYYPDGTPAGQAGDRLPGGEDVTLRTEDGLDLGAWLFPPSRDDRNVAVLVLPGNGGNRAGRIRLADTLTARGFTVLLLDYRGYAGNPGSPSEAGLGADARAGSAVLADRGFAPACTLYLGESLG